MAAAVAGASARRALAAHRQACAGRRPAGQSYRSPCAAPAEPGQGVHQRLAADITRGTGRGQPGSVSVPHSVGGRGRGGGLLLRLVALLLDATQRAVTVAHDGPRRVSQAAARGPRHVSQAAARGPSQIRGRPAHRDPALARVPRPPPRVRVVRPGDLADQAARPSRRAPDHPRGRDRPPHPQPAPRASPGPPQSRPAPASLATTVPPGRRGARRGARRGGSSSGCSAPAATEMAFSVDVWSPVRGEESNSDSLRPLDQYG